MKLWLIFLDNGNACVRRPVLWWTNPFWYFLQYMQVYSIVICTPYSLSLPLWTQCCCWLKGLASVIKNAIECIHVMCKDFPWSEYWFFCTVFLVWYTKRQIQAIFHKWADAKWVTIWNRTRPRVPVQNRQTWELISAWKPLCKHNKDPSCLW